MMGKKVSTICLIAPTDEVCLQSEQVIKKYNKNVQVYKGSIVNAEQITEELIRWGAKIFISRRGTRSFIERKFHVQTTEIPQNLGDYLPILEQIQHEKGLIAFFRYGTASKDLETMCKVLHINMKFYLFSDLSECETAVKQAVEDGAVVGIGGADSDIFAEKYGLEHLIVENSEDSLLQAIDAAEQLQKLMIEEQMKQHRLNMLLERYDMIFNYTHDAIIAVDESADIVVLNKQAEDIIRHEEKSYIGKNIESILPNSRMKAILKDGHRELNQLMNINGTIVSTNRIPIIVDEEVVGAVATFQDVKTLQDNEKKIRLKMHKKGLIAKYHFKDIIGDSLELKNCMRLAAKFAESDGTILLHGETGTGKELFAQSIHNASLRAEGPFVAINCGALPRNLMESELFGYEEGAFTGAVKGGKQGIFEMAHGGTVFLDEIGELPLDIQVHLLRVLQEKEVRRIGSDYVIPVDVRIIAATNRDLMQEVSEKTFREDLYYRLNVLDIEIPPVRERGDDYRKIAECLYAGYRKTVLPGEFEMLDEILRRMRKYSWPGNVREIRNLMERLSILISQGEEKKAIEKYLTRYLNPNLLKQKEEPEVQLTRKEKLEREEKERILKALHYNNMQIVHAAESLEISRSTLWRKIKKYGIELKKE